MTVTRRVPTVPTPSLATLAWATLLAATCADLATTAVGLQLGASEANPHARAILVEHGMAGLAVMKGLLIALIATTTVAIGDDERLLALCMPAAVAAIWALAACWNALLLLTVTQ